MFRERSNQVAVGSHISRIPPGKRGWPHAESRVVFAEWHHIFHARVFGKLDQARGVIVFRGEERKKIIPFEITSPIVLVVGPVYSGVVHSSFVPVRNHLPSLLL